MFEELLDNVVTEHIRHELPRIRVQLAEYSIFLVAICGLKLLLDEARAMLVTTEFDNMLIYVLTPMSTQE